MMRGRRLGAALIASTLLGLSAPLTAAPPALAQQPVGQPVAPVAGAPALIDLDVDSLSPRVVTSATQTITIKGKVTNTGDRRLDQVTVRLQRGNAVASDRELRDIKNQETNFAGPFQEVSKRLEPGDSTEFTVGIPVSGPNRTTLSIGEPGVYPLLVNVNGRPDYSGAARLGAVSIALPVLSVPGGPAAGPKSDPPVVTMLWPLLDEKPRQLAATDGVTVLADDELSDSLAAGGRLFNLLKSVSTAAESNSELLRSICFAVDPDLLQTVSNMAKGYQVRTTSGQLVAGKGRQAATDWLAQVQDLTNGHCVIAVPYADADLVALSRAGSTDLAQLALTSSSIVKSALAIQPLEGVYWPAGGTFDQPTLIDLANVGDATVLVDPAHLEDVDGSAPYVLNTQTAHPVRALPVDSLVSDALASPTTSTPAPVADTGGSVQNGLAALVYRAAFDQRAGGQVLIAPPRRWLASGEELTQFLELAGELFDRGFTSPRSLDQTVTAPNGGAARALSFSPSDSAQEIPPQVTAQVMRINSTRRDLLDSMADDNTNKTNPNQLLAPIQYGLLRGVSTAWRGHVQDATTTVDYVDGRLDALRDLVVVTNPGRPLSLASGDSPIPVRIYNGLPVTIVVRISLSPVPGLRVEPIQDVRIPPGGSAPRYIPAEVSRSGRFSVDVQLTTPGGTSVGEPVRLELNSSSYGIISVAVTGTAGAVLVLLVGFRIFRRVRAARADEAKVATGSGEEIVERSLRSDHHDDS
ncbi:DUF6049 family protein [Actinophytocola sp.]|uniref:DUF6049 family protein n=1 Tax=Actinophytocola sp. TaxID=1872138 RepID=UPI002D4E3E95|nr:DUF6049 family protein [Actinophytocola sp.]HYQ66849.1 DUF6049 family protein [Actinophytocola sp.]